MFYFNIFKILLSFSIYSFFGSCIRSFANSTFWANVHGINFSTLQTFLIDICYLPSIINLVYLSTEGIENNVELRIFAILDSIKDKGLKYLALSYAISCERIFNTKILDIYNLYMKESIESDEYCEFGVHLLKYIAAVDSKYLTTYLSTVEQLISNKKPVLQAVLVQFFIETTQHDLLLRLIEESDNLSVLALALNLISELGAIPPKILITLFKKIGEEKIIAICTEHVSVETPVGLFHFSKITNTWNGASVNSVVYQYIKSTEVTNWTMEYVLIKLIIEQPLDLVSKSNWKSLFNEKADQFCSLMKVEEKAEQVFELIGLYITSFTDLPFFQLLLPTIEPCVAAAKEVCRHAATEFLAKVSKIGSIYKQIAQTLILLK